MKFIELYAKIILEALPLKTYKSWMKKVKNIDYKNRYRDIFGDEFRIYIPLESGKEVVDVSPPEEIGKVLKDNGYEIENYKVGLAKKGKNIFKIGKVLGKVAPELKQKFDQDKNRSGVKVGEKDLLVVISRHPYDILGMSTDRGWSSCMNLSNGTNKNYILSDIKEGTLIAYCIRNNDKNIEDPICRVLIKPFVENSDDGEESDKFLLVQESKVYGTNVKGFVEAVEEWLDKVNEKIVPGYYKLKRSLYCDSSSKTVHSSDKNSKEYIEKLVKFFQDEANIDVQLITSKQIKTLADNGYLRILDSNSNSLLIYAYKLNDVDLFGYLLKKGLTIFDEPKSLVKYIKYIDNFNLNNYKFSNLKKFVIFLKENFPKTFEEFKVYFNENIEKYNMFENDVVQFLELGFFTENGLKVILDNRNLEYYIQVDGCNNNKLNNYLMNIFKYVSSEFVSKYISKKSVYYLVYNILLEYGKKVSDNIIDLFKVVKEKLKISFTMDDYKKISEIYENEMGKSIDPDEIEDKIKEIIDR